MLTLGNEVSVYTWVHYLAEKIAQAKVQLAYEPFGAVRLTQKNAGSSPSSHDGGLGKAKSFKMMEEKRPSFPAEPVKLNEGWI